MDDDELTAAMAGGDDRALRELFSRHAPWLATRLCAVLPAADVEDVLQETFLAAWRGAASYRLAGASGWLWGIARRQAALWLRRRGHPESLATVLVAGERRPADPAEAAILRAELAEASPRSRVVSGPADNCWARGSSPHPQSGARLAGGPLPPRS